MPAAYFSVLQNSSRRKKLLIVAILVLWLVTLCRAISILAPGNIYVSYDSDGAIPILMANDQLTSRAKLTTLAKHYRLSPFHGDQQRELANTGFALALRTS